MNGVTKPKRRPGRPPRDPSEPPRQRVYNSFTTDTYERLLAWRDVYGMKTDAGIVERIVLEWLEANEELFGNIENIRNSEVIVQRVTKRDAVSKFLTRRNLERIGRGKI